MTGQSDFWEENRPNALPVVIVCSSSLEKSQLFMDLGSSGRKAGLVVELRKGYYSLLLKDKLRECCFYVTFLCTNQWSWSKRLLEAQVKEVFFTRESLTCTYGHEVRDCVQTLPERGGNLFYGLYGLFKEDPDLSYYGLSFLGEEDSISEEFDFPLSLARTGMYSLFIDPFSPTREEFLLGLVLEGVSGKTDREKEAILQAEVYCKG